MRNDLYKIIRYYKRFDGLELFDLENDSKELHNLYKYPNYQKVVKKMKKELLKEIKQKDNMLAKTIFFKK